MPGTTARSTAHTAVIVSGRRGPATSASALFRLAPRQRNAHTPPDAGRGAWPVVPRQTREEPPSGTCRRGSAWGDHSAQIRWLARGDGDATRYGQGPHGR